METQIHKTNNTLRGYLEAHPEGFSGTVGGLLKAVQPFRPDECRFPGTPKGFGDAFTRILRNMKRLGFDVEKASRRERSNDGYHCFLRRGRASW